MKVLIVVPWGNGEPDFPGIEPEDEGIQGWTIGSYAPPPPGTAPYVLLWLTATSAIIAILKASSNCLYICKITEEGFETADLAPTNRVQVRDKIVAMGFEGAQYGRLNAAIMSSQKRDELAVAIGTKAFFRSVYKDFMYKSQVLGAY